MKSQKKLSASEKLAELQKVVSYRDAEFIGLKGKNPLAQACSIVTTASGFSLDPSSEVEKTLPEICNKSRVMFREIKLPAEWWKQDHGNLIGKYQNQPVALLYKNYRYYIFSPATLTKTQVDEKSAQELQPVGIMLYPALPEKVSVAQTMFDAIFRRKQTDYLYLGIAGILAAVLGFIFPFSNKILFDRIVPNFNYTLFVQIILGLTVAVFSSTLFSFARSFFSLRLNGHIAHELQMKLWDRLLKLPVNFFRKYYTGDLVQRTLVFNQIRRSLSQSTLIVIFDSIFALSYLAMMLFFSWQLTLLVVGVIALASVAYFFIILLKIRWDAAILASNAKINSFLVQMIGGIEKLRTAAAEKRVFAAWSSDFAENQTLSLKSQFLQVTIGTISSATNIVLILLIFGGVIWMRAEEISSMSIGVYLAFTAAFSPFSQAFFSLFGTASSLIALVPFWRRVKPLITTPPEITTAQKHPGWFTGTLDMKNLFFRYSKQAPFVIKDLCLKIDAKSFVGIVGATGCGKSTLARLLVGFETPERGCVCYDEKDLRDLDLSEVRKQVNAILQQNAIFAGKILDNILCGMSCSEEDLQVAIKLATFDEDLKRYPAGLQMILPSGGELLSGGERQRLLLTRTLLRKPKILILDEGLNSLDSPAQKKIVENLQSLPMTKILFTHQLNILEKLDKIFVMQEGRIIAEDTFEKLYENEPYFRQLVETQSV